MTVVAGLAVNPRHPFPRWHAEFAPRGWWVFRTDDTAWTSTAHAVLCASLPAACAARFGFCEHVAASPEFFRARLAHVADALEAHAMTCDDCWAVLRIAVSHTVLARESTEGLSMDYSPEERADELFDAVSESLRDHRDLRATKSELRASLVRADTAFQELHDWISSGNPLPEPWRAIRLAHPLSNGVGPEEPDF